MVNTCCDPKCDSGRKESLYEGSFFKFPNGQTDILLREKWMKAFPVTNWTPSGSARLCERHFSPEKIATERQDLNKPRKEARGAVLRRRSLKKDVVPHLWPDWPAYLSKDVPKERNISSTANARQQKDDCLKEQQKIEALEKDRVNSLEDIQQKLTKAMIPPEVNGVVDATEKLLFTSIISDPLPKTKFSVTIRDDLSFQMVCNGVLVPNQKIAHIITKQKVEYSAEIIQIINFLKNYSEKETASDEYYQTSCYFLKAYLSSCEVDREKATKIQFILEQLQLAFTFPTRRRYSATTIALCIMWYKASPTLYKQILSDEVFSIPSVSYLRRLSNALTVDLDFSESTIAYLKCRFSKLDQREQNVAIVLDEVHSKQRVEYVAGKFIGSDEDGGVTKSLLCIMVKSLGGKYCDIVAMLPVTTLNSSQMKNIFMKVLKGITDIGFTTCAILVDGNRINMKFYKDELCNGKMMSFVENPFKAGDKIFPLFDTPHIFKCFYNIFMTRNEFKCPAFKEFETINPVKQ